MHLLALRTLWCPLMISFNSLCLGFFHASSHRVCSIQYDHHFQFPLLGIFPCIENDSPCSRSGIQLSIPFAWDFSMHPVSFDYLFYCPNRLSIPFAWDFSMHLIVDIPFTSASLKLSIPFAWDFSMHPMINRNN